MEIDHLALLAGPTCSGKSTLINNINKERLFHIKESLEPVNVGTWKNEDAYKIDKSAAISINNILLHYAFPILKLSNDPNFDFATERDLSALSVAENITLITLVINKNELLKQIRKRQNRLTLCLLRFSNITASIRQKKRLRRLRKTLSENDAILISAYKQWFDFCESLNLKKHVIIANGEKPYILLPSEWRDVVM